MADTTLLDQTETQSNEDNSFEMSENFGTVNKRKGVNNHENRPYPMSELFNPPASSTPIIVSLVSEPESLKSLSLTEKVKFIYELVQIIGPVSKGTKWAPKGDLFIYPASRRQKIRLLKLRSVKEFQISCALARSEREARGIIQNVSVNNSDSDLCILLSDQNVTDVKRLTTGVGKNPTLTVLLFFKHSPPQTMSSSHMKGLS